MSNDAELVQSEQCFSNTFNFAPIGMAIVSMTGHWLKVNQSLCNYLGYTMEEMLSKTLREVTHPDDVNITAEYRQRMLAGEIDTCQLEKRYCHKSGAEVWVSLSTSMVRGVEGEPLYFVSQMVEITERKHNEQELRIHRTNLETLVERRTQELLAANEELNAMNEEMTAMNEEITAMNEELISANESLQYANQHLETEITIRQQKEQEVLLRERQYQATTSLLTHPTKNFDEFLKTILQNAIQLVGAPGGAIGLQEEISRDFVIRHVVGDNPERYVQRRSVDQGMLGEVFRSGELLFVENYQHYPHRIANNYFDRSTAVIMVPLKLGAKVMGALTASWQDDNHLVTTEDVEIIRQFGILASIALERVHANQQIAYQNQLLQGLAEMTTTLVNELDLDKVLSNILNQAASFLGIPHGFIQLFEPDGVHSAIQCALGRYELQVGKRLNFNGAGISAQILQTGKMMIIDDYSLWPHRLKDPLSSQITAALQAPLKIGEKIIGSIGLSIFGEPIIIDRKKLAIFEQFAIVASIAVKNALSHQETNRLAFHDTLTGLPNRAHLNVRLEEEMKKTRSAASAVGAVMFIDLDDLKTVNDSFGHSCGDEIIKAAAAQIAGVVGPDSFVARVGGDEFIVILPGEENHNRIAQIADMVMSASHREYDISGRNIHMSASIGVTVYPTDGNNVEEILKNADSAMYAAKAAGRNCWRFYNPGLLKDAYDKMLMTSSLRRALTRGELYLQYQPQFSLISMKIVGFEALLRWNSQEHGMVSPVRFIPMAEQSGMIHPIGQWVLEEAVLFAKELASRGLSGLHVAVNVSPRQLAADDFVEIVRRCIADASIRPSLLEIEITENTLIESLEDSTRKLNELSDQGVRLSLDDFGTGYSSLTYLRNLPVGTLKIDKSFIDKMLQDREQENFVKSIIDMAHALGLNVVAEGVETDLQLQKLAQFDCDCIQGYVFSRPVSKEEALRFCQK